MPSKVYLNGKLLDASTARVSVSSPAFLHGVGLFETLRAYQGRPFLLDRHIERMRRSAEKLNMSVGQTLEQVNDAVRQLLAINKLTEARIRFTITPPSPQDVDQGPTLLVAAQELSGYPRELYKKGMTVCLCDEYRQSNQDPLTGHKTTSYLPRLLALRNAQDRSCGEALWFTPQNLLAEGSISNVFIVKDGCIFTPPVDTPILAGITRSTIIELARQMGLTVEESSTTVNDLLKADEVFLTNAIMEVMPVTRIEKKAIADEKPGPITSRLSDAYWHLATTLS